ncbi:hypothetical protein BJV77DRAFT_244300 [Russula vinacea]|nr:hypothetical protein BJV77DRAFT_244300 [Russula vinacea]
MSRGERDLIVLTLAGASALPFSASKPAVLPVLFVCLGSRATALSSLLLSPRNMRSHVVPHRYRRLPETKKNLDKKNRPASRWFRFISG